MKKGGEKKIFFDKIFMTLCENKKNQNEIVTFFTLNLFITIEQTSIKSYN